MLRLSGVGSGYGKEEVLHGIDFEVSRPAIYVVLGPNGVGKTTLFRTIAGILKPMSGTIDLDGLDLYRAGASRHEIGYLSHLSALPEEMTVKRALEFYAEIESGEISDSVDTLGLRELLSKKVGDLSQGQKKRASIAKLFLRERRIYLMDEPTSSLDPVVAKEVRDKLLELSRNKFVMYSSHNLYEAQEIGDYVVLLKEGRLSFFGSMDELKAKGYRIGIRSSADLTALLPRGKRERDYFVLPVSGPEEVGEVVRKIVEAGIMVYEVKEFGNPLEDLFVGGAD